MEPESLGLDIAPREQVLLHQELHYGAVEVRLMLLGLINRSTKDLGLILLVDGGQSVAAKPEPRPPLTALQQYKQQYNRLAPRSILGQIG